MSDSAAIAAAGTVGADADAVIAADGHTHETACLNCGTRLIGEHCHTCGQRAHVHKTMGAFFHDLLHGVLHFEGKTWRTLPMLAWRPGDLTRRYIEGERARFVSPLGLFLFSVFIMFVVFSTVGAPRPTETNTQVRTGMAESAKAVRERIGGLEERRAEMLAARRPTAEVDAQLKELREEESLMQGIERDGMMVGISREAAKDMPDGFWKKAADKFNKDPALTLYKLQNNAYKFSWLLIPITVPLVWLLFLWRRRHWELYDHTVFVTYSLCFQSLVLVVAALLAAAGAPLDWLAAAVGLIITFHVYRQFRGAYQLGRFSALWRMMAITVMFSISSSLFLMALIAIGAVG